jgi:hypothetical protein
MKRIRELIAVVSFSLSAIVCGTASGVEVYKWTESDGVIHYAEAPPESGLASLEILDVVVAKPASPAVADYQSVLDVASSIEASRLERERVRLEREKLLLQKRQLKQSQLLAEQYYDNRAGAGVYYMPYYRSRYPLKPYPHHNYGRHPVPTPYSNGGQPYTGRSAPGRVYLNR